MNKASGVDRIPAELFQILKDDAVKSVAFNMPANLENLVATGLKKSVFIPIVMKGNAKECSNYHTTALISHASNVMLKIHQVRFQQYMNQELPDVKAGFRKGRGTRGKMPTSVGSQKKQGNFRETSTFASLTTLKPLTTWITTNWENLKEMGIPDYLTCLLRNLNAGQEARGRTRHGTMDWFKIVK